jgi:hydrogenase maturation protein HypF
MKKALSTKIIFKGIVQGVGFRPMIYRVATQLDACGYVLNKGSEVEVVIDTDPDVFIKHVYKYLPSIARISSVQKSFCHDVFDTFEIRYSSQGDRRSLIPADTALCDDCHKELFDEKNRRYHFPFTNCTVCGARFSVIEDVPYDRERTAMKDFPLCNDCGKEYKDPSNRRYHAQTISCPLCGPLYHLFDVHGNDLGSDAAIQRFAEMLDMGKIGVMKSWGGMHLCCTLDQVERFRTWYKRPQKAFAVMVKDIDTARRYAEVSLYEEELLRSGQRPIVLVKKKNEDGIAPGLDTIGLFLPYSGAHHILFSYLSHDALVMTSANIPGEPMILSNEKAFFLHADAYLLHNRDIINRVDDTVIKPWRDKYFFIRKSRGFIPGPIDVSYRHRILGVGAGENIQGAVSTDKMMHLTQYIGDGQYYPTLVFLQNAIEHLMRLTMNSPSLDAVAMDLHPHYETRSIAKRFSEMFDAPIFEVQHHHAHAASLLLDRQVEESIILTLDGAGYGDDGTLWGGEVLQSDVSSYKRICHLLPIPLIGGDKAVLEPRRIVYSLLGDLSPSFIVSDDERNIFEHLAKKSVFSSSFGRILDALSCYLGICQYRTYDGEPAMKLEPYLAKGNAVYSFNISDSSLVLDTSDMFRQLYEYTKDLSHPFTEQQKSDLSFSFVSSLVGWLTHHAISHALDVGITSVGVTGGISYNLPIMDLIEKHVTSSGLNFLMHNRIPNGDGGIAAGQNCIVAAKI